MRISDWSSDVCSSDLADPPAGADGAPASPQKEDDNETDGWQCAKDVAWGAVEDTVVGTVIGVFSSAAAEPDMKYSGGNSSGQRIPRGKIQYGRILLRDRKSTRLNSSH